MSILLIVEASLYTVLVIIGFVMVAFKAKKTNNPRKQGAIMMSAMIFLYILFLILITCTISFKKNLQEFTTKYPDENNPSTFTAEYFKDYKFIESLFDYRVTLIKAIIYMFEAFFLMNVVLSEILVFFRQGKHYEIKKVNMSSLTTSQTESMRRAKKTLAAKRKSKKSLGELKKPSNKYSNNAYNKANRMDNYKPLTKMSKSNTDTSWKSKLQTNYMVNAFGVATMLVVYLVIFSIHVIKSRKNNKYLNLVDFFIPLKVANFVFLCIVIFTLLISNFYYIAVKNNNLSIIHSEYYVMVSVELVIVFFIFFLIYDQQYPLVFKFLYQTAPTKVLKFSNDTTNYFDLIYKGDLIEQFSIFRGVIYILFCSIAKLLPYVLDITKEVAVSKVK